MSSKRDEKHQKLTRRSLLKASGGVTVAALLAACGQGATPESQPTAVPAEPTTVPPTPTLIPTPTPVAGAPELGGTLLEGRTYETTSLDPKVALNTEAGQIIMARMYQTLVAPGPNLRPQPQLATSWAMTDEQTWEFKIRQGVKFHNGDDFTVEDVKFTYDLIMDPDVGHPAGRYLGDVDSVEIVDSETIHFNMRRTNIVFPNQQHWSYILPRSVQDEPEGFLQNNVVGTGPFMLEEWQPDVVMRLAKNPDYWEQGRPFLDGITMRVFPEESSAIAALRTGEIDFITLENPNNFQLLTANPNLNLFLVPANGGNFWCFNGDREPLNDLKVRQAISTAIDREEVLQVVGAGLGSVTGMVTPAFGDLHVPAAELPFYEYDPERARQLLQESSVPDGFQMDCLYINTLPVMQNGAQLFQKYMQDIGIEVELRGMETNVWVDTVTGTEDFYFTTNLDIGGPTPEAVATSFACGSVIADWYGPCFEEMDAMVNDAQQATDEEERQQIIHDIQIFAAENLPTIFTYARTHVVAAQKWVQNFVPYPDKAHRELEEVWLLDKPA